MGECCMNARRGHGLKNKKGKEMVRNVGKSSWRRVASRMVRERICTAAIYLPLIACQKLCNRASMRIYTSSLQENIYWSLKNSEGVRGLKDIITVCVVNSKPLSFPFIII